jgi:hypothetical protein
MVYEQCERKILVSWVISCNLVYGYQHFRGTWFLLLYKSDDSHFHFHRRMFNCWQVQSHCYPTWHHVPSLILNYTSLIFFLLFYLHMSYRDSWHFKFQISCPLSVFKLFHQRLRPCVTFWHMLVFYRKKLSVPTQPQNKNYCLSAVHNSLCYVFTTNIHISWRKRH